MVKPLSKRAQIKLGYSWIALSKQKRWDIATRLRFKCLSNTSKYTTDYYKGYADCIDDLETMLKRR